ncbi:MAG: hypothetical protein QXO70_04825 [Candidatus Pacearchaeota archaeon]
MVHKIQMKDVEVKAILILAQPTQDIKEKLPEGVPIKEVKEDDFYSDLDSGMDEFINSLGGFDNKDKPLIGEMYGS